MSYIVNTLFIGSVTLVISGEREFGLLGSVSDSAFDLLWNLSQVTLTVHLSLKCGACEPV